jgi:type II secretion system protein G
MKTPNKPLQSGSTLIVLGSVIAIIFMIAGAFFVGFQMGQASANPFNAISKAWNDVQNESQKKLVNIQRAEQDINNIYSALYLYQSRNGQWPDQRQGLEALVSMPTSGIRPANWTQIMDSVPVDPWNMSYQYRNPAQRDPSGVDVFSFGPDRKEATNNIYRRLN